MARLMLFLFNVANNALNRGNILIIQATLEELLTHGETCCWRALERLDWQT